MLTFPFGRPDPLTSPPEYAHLRETAPVTRVQTPNAGPAWLVTSYDAVVTVLSDRRFGVTPPGAAYPGNDTLFQDGEAHGRLRRLVAKAFGPRGVESMRARVERIAEEHVGAIARKGTSAELVAELAGPMSMTVIGELLGVEIADRERLQVASGADFVFGGEEEVLQAGRAWEELSAYAAALVEARRAAPGDDLLSSLIAVRDAEDGRLSDGELIAMTATIVSAGYLSARNAMSAAVLLLLREGRLVTPPEQLAATVEEVLRLQSGLTGEPFPRFAQADVELAGASIRAGDLVLVQLEAAHRDPRHFADPDAFLPGRRSSPSLAFGHGMHYCLGAPLARLEVAAVLGALARHLPGLRLLGPAVEVAWVRDGIDIGPAALHVTW